MYISEDFRNTFWKYAQTFIFSLLYKIARILEQDAGDFYYCQIL